MAPDLHAFIRRFAQRDFSAYAFTEAAIGLEGNERCFRLLAVTFLQRHLQRSKLIRPHRFATTVARVK